MTTTYVGIDVAKAELVVHVRPTDAAWTVPNDEVGVGALVERLRVIAPALIVLEATGGYELAAFDRHLRLRDAQPAAFW